MSSQLIKRLPHWFKISHTTGNRLRTVRNLIEANNLHTVCQSAACPNRNECWNAGTATFLLLGNICTRGCRFCGVPKGIPLQIDRAEPDRVAGAVLALKLKYAVITSVTRDDLEDGGADIIASTIKAIHARTPECRVEVLIPDFQGSETALKVVLKAQPDVLNHNVETVPSLYARVRPQADYRRSIDVLAYAKDNGAITKTGIMLGLGENRQEILDVMKDLRQVGCSILTLGQYLQPNKDLLPVHKYYHPDEFKELRSSALRMGFNHVVSGPLVRSSYHAEEYVDSPNKNSSF